MKPLVSVVLRTRPGRKHLLSRSLRSVIAQRYRPIEVVIVEDGGETVEPLARQLSEEVDLEVRYIALRKVGRCLAGNAGMERCRGEFVNFLDDDDLLMDSHLFLLVPELIRSKNGAAYAAAYLSYSDISSLEPLIVEEHRRELFGRQAFDLAALWTENQFPIQAVLFRRSLFERFGGLASDLEAYEDWDLWLRYSAETDFTFVDAVTSRFRVPVSLEERDMRRKIHLRYLPVVRRRMRELKRQYIGSPFERRLELASRGVRLDYDKWLAEEPR